MRLGTTYGSSYGPEMPKPNIQTYHPVTGDKTIVVHNSSTGLAFPQPLIIPGVGPNGSTTVVQTNPIKFDQDTPLTTGAMILPGGQPFIPSPGSFIPESI